MAVLTPHNAGRLSDTRPFGLLGRVILVAAWAAFWLGTALFPCCEPIAAVLDDHTGTAQHQPAAHSPPADIGGEAHSSCPDHSSDAPCGSILASVPVVSGESEVPAPERSPAEKSALADSLAFNPASALRSEDRGLVPAVPPPPLRFHERTRRLLI